ncbi:tumor protein p73 isoform X1 [Arapaima gigas]
MAVAMETRDAAAHRMRRLRAGQVVCPTVDYLSAKMSQSSSADEGTTFEHLWSTLEPDSTYFELPQGSHPGNHETPSSLPPNRAEVCMDVFHMRDMNETVMVRRGFSCSPKGTALWEYSTTVKYFGIS